MSRTPQEQLVHFLSDMYSVEQQALAQLVSAGDVAGHPLLAADYREHYAETKQQAERVRSRLEAHGGSPSTIKDAVMKLGGKGFLLFARVQPETPGRLACHAYAYEAMEWAGYEMLARFARAANDARTEEVAHAIAAEERAMMGRLERGFDLAEEASHAGLMPDELNEHVCRHLADVHAFEKQGTQLLSKSERIAGSSELEVIYRQHAATIDAHADLVEQRLEDLNDAASTLKDAALAFGGLNWGLFFQAQSDTSAKFAAFVYAFLHLEIGGYELLQRTAARAGDTASIELCERILGDKRAFVEKLSSAFDSAVETTLVTVQS